MSADESPQSRRSSMTQDEERERRASIQAIMKDSKLTPQERRKSIQYLMDGRRRSSVFQDSAEPNGSVAAAAAMAAYELGSLSDDDEDDMIPEDGVANPSSRRMSSRSVRRLSSLGGSRRSSLRGSFNGGYKCTDIPEKLEKSRPPCGHYQRKCSIVSPCCGLVFGCRICHDDSPELPPPFLRRVSQESDTTMDEDGKMPHNGNGGAAHAIDHRSASLPANFDEEETHHSIDRFAIAEVICRECYTRQSSKTNNCIHCHVQFGEYHCNICNLWMAATDKPYHCDKCGFCRVGGREDFKHCDDCGMCIDIQLFHDHNCKNGKYMSNCPVCQEDLFSSRMASHEMPCGHAIHWHCFKELTSFDTRCPVCKKTAESDDQMESTWAAMAMGITMQPVPADMARVVNITCIDCETKGTNQRWHFLGVQCNFCHGFNTTVDETVMTGQEAADFLGPPPPPPSSSDFSAAGVDQNVLAALMDHGGEVLAENGLAGDASMEADEFDPNIAAEVLSYVNSANNANNGSDQSMAEDMEEDENEEWH